ncbi:Guanine nucleotide-binding protein subunit gamma [Nakaseomyces bracarensis]|uniref:Guanine nucleotide-binding protein subunit gamma n=1 Tax=Nakaseomyces bracarensis TaxID=273131 RepID=A0ABR4NQ17_9SACH
MDSQQQLDLKINQLKLKRINELNDKLRSELQRDRITASNACLSLINYTTRKKDYALPELWGYPPRGTNHFRDAMTAAGQQDVNTCCIIM